MTQASLAQVAPQVPTPFGAGATSPGPTSGGLPHDIRPLLPYVPTWRDYAPWLLAALLALVVLALVYRTWKKTRKPPPPVVVDPWAELQRDVRAVRIEAPFGPPAQRECFYRLSLLLREAIERRTGIRATDSTLAEMRQPVRKKMPLPNFEIEEILVFLERSDLVKFADHPAAMDEAIAAQNRVAVWCDRLRPVAEVSDQILAASGSGVAPAEARTP